LVSILAEEKFSFQCCQFTVSPLNYGVTPSIAIGNDCHLLQLGPRITPLMFQAEKQKKQFIFDAGYRFNFFHSRKGLSIFTSFRAEFAKESFAETWIYDPTNEAREFMYDLGDEPIDMRTDININYGNLHIGLGIQHEFFNGLFIKAEGGYGIQISSEDHAHHQAIDNQIRMTTGTLMEFKYHSWISSAGIGFAF
jgi:hypothetical protein